MGKAMPKGGSKKGKAPTKPNTKGLPPPYEKPKSKADFAKLAGKP